MSKFAYLFGLNYPGTSSSLRGCINDAQMMHAFLQGRGFECETYTDEVRPADAGYDKILEVLNRAIDKTHEGSDPKTVWIHFSGHGTHIKDRTASGRTMGESAMGESRGRKRRRRKRGRKRGGKKRVKRVKREERDGRDECIVPSDYSRKGLIIDDQINDILVRARSDAKIVFVFDCCHSGTAADLPYLWNKRGRGYRIGRECDRPACKVLSISGCEDRQTSADAYNVLGDGRYVGALSAVLLRSMERSPHLLNDVRKILKVVRMTLKSRGFSQRPVLCSSYNIHRNRRLL